MSVSETRSVTATMNGQRRPGVDPAIGILSVGEELNAREQLLAQVRSRRLGSHGALRGLEAIRPGTEDGARSILREEALSRRKPCVVIVDDQPELLVGFRQLLENDGIEIFMFPSLIMLPFRLKEIDPDVILVDVNMPALSGTAIFSKELRRSLRTTALLILFSGIESAELWSLADRVGADGALSKRLDVADSLLRVHSWIRQRQAMTSDARSPESLRNRLTADTAAAAGDSGEMI